MTGELFYNNHIIWRVGCLSVSLIGSKAGPWQLVFGLEFQRPGDPAMPGGQPVRLVGVASGLRLAVSFNNNIIGFALPDHDALEGVGGGKHQLNFSLFLDAAGIASVEDLRAGNDASFQLKLTGMVKLKRIDQQAGVIPNPLQLVTISVHGAEYYPQQRGDTLLQHTIPKSDWVRKLQEAGFATCLLYEIRFPEGEPFANKRRLFQNAQKAFFEGRYADAVAACREILNGLGTGLSCSRKVVDHDHSLAERYQISLCSLKQIVSTAHHRDEFPDEPTRAMADYVLGSTALLLSLHSRQPGLFRPTSSPTASEQSS